MSGEERRGKIIQALKNSDKAVSATTLAKEFDVSRQVIVQDVALLRANVKTDKIPRTSEAIPNPVPVPFACVCP